MEQRLNDPLFRVKDGGEFRQTYGQELLDSPRLRTELQAVENIHDAKTRKVALANLEADVLLSRVPQAKRAQITDLAQNGTDFVKTKGNIFERLATEPTAAKSEVDGVNTTLDLMLNKI